MLVISSWIGFFIDHKCVPARVFAPTTLFLAAGRIETQFGHATAEGAYQLTCYVFVFATLIEFGIVHYVATRNYSSAGKCYRRRKRSESPLENVLSASEYLLLDSDIVSQCDTTSKALKRNGKMHNNGESSEECVARTEKERSFSTGERYSHKVDVFARFAFPVAFLLYNTAFWVTYCV